MINKIKISEKYSINKIMLFKEADITMLPDKRIVPLFGPNGAGKTTMINAILNTMISMQTLDNLLSNPKTDEEDAMFYKNDTQRQLYKKGCFLETDNVPHKVLHYQNSSDNFRSRQARSYEESFNPFFINARFDANSISEGQSIIYSVSDLFDIMKPGKDMVSIDGGDTIVLIDELDSGMSIDNLDMFLRKIKNILRKRKDIQIFLTFNNPRILKHFPYVVSMYDGSVKEMHTDEDMLKEIRVHKKEFDKIRKKSNGMPKIYD